MDVKAILVTMSSNRKHNVSVLTEKTSTLTLAQDLKIEELKKKHSLIYNLDMYEPVHSSCDSSCPDINGTQEEQKDVQDSSTPGNNDDSQEKSGGPLEGQESGYLTPGAAAVNMCVDENFVHWLSSLRHRVNKAQEILPGSGHYKPQISSLSHGSPRCQIDGIGTSNANLFLHEM